MALLSLFMIASCISGCSRTTKGEENTANHMELYSDKVQQAIAHIKQYGIDRVFEDWPITNVPPSDAQYEVHELVHSPIPTIDMPRYWLYYDASSNLFWVQISGGYAGKMEWRGPVTFVSEFRPATKE